MPETKQPQDVDISATAVGEIKIAPPTFLERWGVVFLACGGAWILLVSAAMLVYFFFKQPVFPDVTGQNPEQITQILNLHRQLEQQWSESLTQIFDLLVTRTVLPIVTLLLGYLFGKTLTSG